LRDYRGALVWWGIGLIILTVVYILFYPTIVNSAPDLTSYMEKMPEALKAFVGGNEYTTPVGYLNSEIFGIMAPLIFIIFAISFGSFAVAGEEEKGTLDVLLAYPVTRNKVILQKTIALAVLLAILGVLLFIGLAIGSESQNMKINMGHLAEITFSLSLLALLFGTLSFFIGAAFGKRGVSIGIATSFAIGSYLLNTLGKVVDVLKPYRQLMPFYYYNEANPLANGINWGHALILVGAVVALLILSLLAFRRRDLNI
jgi:ABC-2 type transport system permease protein